MKISELPAASSLTSTDVAPVVHSSTTQGATLAQIVAAAVAAVGADGSVLFRDGSSLGGSSVFKYDKTNQSLAVGTGAATSAANCFAFGLNANASGTYSCAIGQASTATAGGALAAGEGCTASAANAIALGWTATASGTYACTLGSYVTASGNASTCIGVNATAARAGEFVHGSGHSGCQHGRFQMYGNGNAAPVVLAMYGGGSFQLNNGSAYAITVDVFARKSDNSACAREQRAFIVRGSGGSAVIDENKLVYEQTAASGMGGIGASVTFSTPSALEFRITGNPGAGHVIFVADVVWNELY